MLVISNAISAQSVTDILPSTSSSFVFNLKKVDIVDINLVDRWMQKLYWNNDAFKDSTNFEHIKTHYYWSHITVSSILHFRWPLDGVVTYSFVVKINPTKIVPCGPVPNIRPL
jgi:glutathionyl-hydroquinone reductase